MSRPRIVLLDAADDDSDNPRNFHRELDAEVCEYHVQSEGVPDHVAFDGCVVTGSRASVYWDEPWIALLSEYVDEVLDAGVPTLGVCFGHQLLADVLGGTVEGMGEYEIGYREIERTAESRLLAGLGESFTAFTTHSDTVSELPPGADLIAENDYGVHGFRTDSAYAVQFHPEYDTATAASVTQGKDLDPERKQRVLDGIDPKTYRDACETKRLFENFLDIVREQSVAASVCTADADPTARTATDD